MQVQLPAPVQFYSKAQAAAVLNCSQRTIEREIASGKIQTVRIGRRLRISREALEKYLNNA